MNQIISEEQYLEIIALTHGIYTKEVIKGSNVTAPYFDLGLQRQRIKEVKDRHRNDFKSKPEAILFELNLLIPNNELFANLLLASCSKFLNLTDISQVKDSFARRGISMTEQWEELIKYMASIYSITGNTTKVKIKEILSFAPLYFPELVEQNQARSLSNR